MTEMPRDITLVPPRLLMPDQDLKQPFHDPAAPDQLTPVHGVWLARIFLFLLPSFLTGLLAHTCYTWFAAAGDVTPPELTLTAVIAFSFFWVAFALGSAVLGLIHSPDPRVTTADPKQAAPLDVAMLVMMYGEDARDTIGRAADLTSGLNAYGDNHRYTLYVLSDTRDMALQRQEELVVAEISREMPNIDIFYRWRPENRDYKSGNLREWVTTQGAGFDAMLVLDADSYMTPETVSKLADLMSNDPTAGLLQPINRLLPGETFWQRMQEFAVEVYGQTLGRGFALWTGNEANYFGHNAMIRTAAFATAAGLPHLPGRRPLGGVILSHDFVEAALIRRAGWSVRMVPEAEDSFETTPEHVPAYIKRDHRWCQGNIQHMRLLRVPGLSWISRFHMLQGAMAYLTSLAWLFLVVLWTLVGDHTTNGLLVYFKPDDPLTPMWPKFPSISLAMVAGLIAVALIAPKVLGAIGFVARGGLRGKSAIRFVLSMLIEIIVAVAIAPILMLQHVRALTRIALGRDGGWGAHQSGTPSFGWLMRFHWLETIAGAVLLGLVAVGAVTVWLIPIGASLAFAGPSSALLALDARNWPLFDFQNQEAARDKPAVMSIEPKPVL